MSITTKLLIRTLDAMNDESLQGYVEEMLRGAARSSGLASPRAKRLLGILIAAATKVRDEP